MFVIILVTTIVLATAYVWLLERALSSTPEEAERLTSPPWTKEMIQDAYRKVQTQPTDVRPFLFGTKQRRYIVVGGSGLVGGWIVQNLYMRGEDPSAIRIVDLNPPRRKAILEQKDIDFVQTNVSDIKAVSAAFQAPWPEQVKALPLTVFHCVAYINASERKPDFKGIYERVNIQGTKNVVQVAKEAGASILVSTSSGSVAMASPSYFMWPWQRQPKDFFQLVPNAEPKKSGDGRPLEDFNSCYAWSKAQAEGIVRRANDPDNGFLTGCIRPGHVIYGDGGANLYSLSWDYLRRGGSPTWISHMVVNFVHAQNVSIAHLAFEDALLREAGSSSPTMTVAGKAYAATDPNPAIRYGDFYNALSTLAHPLTPVKFPVIPTIPLLLLSYLLEAFKLLRARLSFLRILPALKGDVAMIQPAMFHMCTLHAVLTDDLAQREIGYKAPIGSLEGVALAVLEWNNEVEEHAKKNISAGKGEDVKVQPASVVPKATGT